MIWRTVNDASELRRACEGAWGVVFETRETFIDDPAADVAEWGQCAGETAFPARVCVIPSPDEEPEREWRGMDSRGDWLLAKDRAEAERLCDEYGGKLYSRTVVRAAGPWEPWGEGDDG